jgi:hypothetical protein
MRKLIGTCLLCCAWSAPAWACFDEYVPVTNEPQAQPQPQEVSQPPAPELAANAGRVPARSSVSRASQHDWLSIRWGSAGAATLFAGIVLATVRHRRRLVASETIATAAQQLDTEKQA